MLEIQGLNKREYGKILVSDLNLSLELGSLLGILGDDQSGRKDFLDMVSGFKKPNSGKVLIEGKPVVGNVLRARRCIGYSAVLDVYSNFTVQGFLNLMIKVRKIKKDDVDKEIKRILELANFSSDLEEKIKDLDEVEEKRLSIASAFIGKPEIILLDDPFKDIKKEESKEKLAETINLLKKDNIILIATNDGILEQIADKILILTHKGQVEILPDDLKKENVSLKEKQKEILEKNNIKGKHYDR